MKRKIIQLAGKTSVISIPQSWIRKFNIKKGQEVEVKEENNRIIIETDNVVQTKDIKLDISEMNVSTAWYNLISAYRSGAETINVYYNDYILDIKTKENTLSSDMIRDAVNKFTGMEIIKQGKNHAIIKEITTPKIEEFENILKRTYFAVINMSSDIVEGLEKVDKIKINNVSEISEVNVNKLCNFSLRLITKHKKNGIDSLTLYSTIIKLEEIGDNYSKISKIFAESKNEYSKKLIQLFKNLDKMINLFYNISFKHEQDKYNNMAEIKQEIKQEIKDFKTDSDYEKEILQIARGIPELLMEASCIKLTYRIDF